MTDWHNTNLFEPIHSPMAVTAPASRYQHYCEGYFGSDSAHYLLGLSIKTAATESTLTCPGSTLLDEINAFDLAEVIGTNLGQLNLITVSSFCGPQGMIWGYDVCAPSEGHRPMGSVSVRGQHAELFDLTSLTAAFERLIGTVTEKRFPFIPGAHVPAALKVKTSREPGMLYAALALGIPEDRRRQACLMMENTGFLPDDGDWDTHRDTVTQRMAESVLTVGANQHVRYRSVFVGVSNVLVRAGQTGCAMALAPYFRLAQSAFVRGHDLSTMSLERWEQSVQDRFLALHP